MTAWVDPLRRALDHASGPIEFFIRDDDAGWSDDRLLALLDIVAYHGLPIDLAVIPEALTVDLARRLCAHIEGEPGNVEVHQHGFAHINHEGGGRKCEFGPSRSAADQWRDIERGKYILAELLGSYPRPIFTPPWNRCTAVTGTCLTELAFQTLSRDRSAEPLALPGLAELPVSVDWFARRKGVRVSRAELGKLLAVAVESPGPVGIMFHHAMMDAGEMDAADTLLGLLASHEAVRCRPMMTLCNQAGFAPRGDR